MFEVKYIKIKFKSITVKVESFMIIVKYILWL